MTPQHPKTIDLMTRTSEQTVAIGAAIGACCLEGDIIALDGELGAGKTHLTRGLASGLGIDPRHVSSPTFVMVQEYEPSPADAPNALLLVHIDAYRLTGPDDLASIGWDGDGHEFREGAVLAIEWASLIKHALGPDYLHVEIAHDPEGRSIAITPHGGWTSRLASLQDSFADIANEQAND